MSDAGTADNETMRWNTIDRLEGRIAELEAERDRLREALKPIVHEYDLWAEDAGDGEFRLWDLDRLVVAIVNARAALRAIEGGGETILSSDPPVTILTVERLNEQDENSGEQITSASLQARAERKPEGPAEGLRTGHFEDRPGQPEGT